MTTDVVAVRPETSFVEVAGLLYTAAVRAVPVLDPDRHLLGVISEADLLVTAERGAPDRSERHHRRRYRWHPGPADKAGGLTAAALMTAAVVTVAAETTVAEAARTMRRQHVGWLPVVDDDGVVVGVLGRSDLLSVFLRDDSAIRTEIIDEVLGRMLLVDPSRVTVEVTDGVVTLTGELDTRADAVLAVRFVERLEGVVGVVDQLTYKVDERTADYTTMT